MLVSVNRRKGHASSCFPKLPLLWIHRSISRVKAWGSLDPLWTGCSVKAPIAQTCTPLLGQEEWLIGCISVYNHVFCPEHFNSPKHLIVFCFYVCRLLLFITSCTSHSQKCYLCNHCWLVLLQFRLFQKLSKAWTCVSLLVFPVCLSPNRHSKHYPWIRTNWEQRLQ